MLYNPNPWRIGNIAWPNRTCIDDGPRGTRVLYRVRGARSRPVRVRVRVIVATAYLKGASRSSGRVAAGWPGAGSRNHGIDFNGKTQNREPT